MFVVEHLGFSLLLMITGMVTANPGLCPFYPKVHERAKYCYVNEECKTDFNCQAHEKCCENPCGIKLCTDNIIPDPLDKIEKCYKDPNLIESATCKYEQTKFCFIKDCKRCCVHETSCNPSPKLVTDPRNCHSEICGGYSCPQQGAVCFVDETTNTPSCKCNTNCKRAGGYVCASYQNVPQTFRNRCYMEKNACELKKKFKVEYEGRCKPPPKEVIPVERPTIRDPIQTLSLKSPLMVDCYGDRELVRLRWLQRRFDGTDVEVGGIESERGLYEINGRLRKVLRLKIPSVGAGSYGRYVCKQTYDRTTMVSELQVNPIYQVVFDREACKLSVDSGTCTAHLPNYFFNHTSERCEPFNYTGCDGNANNFQTFDDCRIKCQGLKPTNIKFAFTNFGDACGSKQCNYYEECQGNKHCQCPDTCPPLSDPVCATNGRTFISLCAMKVHACRWREHIVAVYKGRCGPFSQHIDEMSHIATPEQPTPEPLSPCERKRCPPYAKCVVHPFTNAAHCYCEKTCSFRPEIICASDRKHYLNECFMKYSSCQQKRKLTVLKHGLCLFIRSLT